MSELEGRWRLVGSNDQTSEVEDFDDHDTPDLSVLEAWLHADAMVEMNGWEPTQGLVLTISSEGTFQEERAGEVAPQVVWYDIEGVLDAQNISPFSGTLRPHAGKVFMMPDDVPGWSLDHGSTYEDVVMRIDDGSTVIVDHLRRQGDTLYRTQNVLTDELYLTRTLMVYELATE